VVLFAYVFGGSIQVPGVPYVEYLMAGIFGQTVVFGSAITGMGLAEDLKRGIIDRFRSLPMSRSAVLVGRTTADLLNNVLVVFIMVICAWLVGWRVHTSFLEVAYGFLVLLAFAYAFSWISAVIGLSVSGPEVAQSAGFIWLFPVTFLSNAFVPIANLNSFFRTVAEWNPLSAVVAAARELFGNTSPLLQSASTAWPMQHPILTTWLWFAVIMAIFVPLAIRQYRRAANR
jgi:ABC-2 type transport system permease protein